MFQAANNVNVFTGPIFPTHIFTAKTEIAPIMQCIVVNAGERVILQICKQEELKSPVPDLCAAACKDSKRALEVSQHSEDMGLILGACAGGLVVLILLLGAVVIIVKKG